MDRRHIHDPVHARGQHRIMGCDDQSPAFCQMQQIFRDESGGFPVQMRRRLVSQNKACRGIGESARNGQPHRFTTGNAMAAITDEQMLPGGRQSFETRLLQRCLDHILRDAGAAETDICRKRTGKKNGFWPIQPMDVRRVSAVLSSRATPPIFIVPLPAEASPAISDRTVDLPQPDGPRSATVSPARMLRLKSRSTGARQDRQRTNHPPLPHRGWAMRPTPHPYPHPQWPHRPASTCRAHRARLPRRPVVPDRG